MPCYTPHLPLLFSSSNPKASLVFSQPRQPEAWWEWCAQLSTALEPGFRQFPCLHSSSSHREQGPLLCFPPLPQGSWQSAWRVGDPLHSGAALFGIGRERQQKGHTGNRGAQSWVLRGQGEAALMPWESVKVGGCCLWGSGLSITQGCAQRTGMRGQGQACVDTQVRKAPTWTGIFQT